MLLRGLYNPRRLLQYGDTYLARDCTAHLPPTGFLVHIGHDDAVSRPQRLELFVTLNPSISIVIPWSCIREVPVDIELVSFAFAL